MMTLNVEIEEHDNDGSERQNWKCDEDGSERWNWKMRLWTSNWRQTMALNAETETVTLNVKLRSDDDDSEHQIENTMTTPNVETEKRWWLWMPNEEVALMTPNVVNCKWTVALNTKLQGNDEGEICPNVAWRCKSRSAGRVRKGLHRSRTMLH